MALAGVTTPEPRNGARVAKPLVADQTLHDAGGVVDPTVAAGVRRELPVQVVEHALKVVVVQPSPSPLAAVHAAIESRYGEVVKVEVEVADIGDVVGFAGGGRPLEVAGGEGVGGLVGRARVLRRGVIFQVYRIG